MNLSQQKREKMLAFLNELKKQHSDDASRIALNQIEQALNEKRYGLVWEEHAEKVEEMLTTHIPVFSEVLDKKLEPVRGGVSSENEQSIGFNFLIEGDNLHSLKLLEKTHRSAVDMIYIDPPYNTGNTTNNDFVYNDKFIDKNDGFSHSKWLSFMEKRLFIAKKLLHRKGIIFISIGDDELYNLKLLMDSIFGEKNYLNTISINMKNIAGASGGGEDKRFKKNIEYLLVYAKNYSEMPILKNNYTYIEISELVEEMREQEKSWKYTSVLINEGDKKYLGTTLDGSGEKIKIYERENYVIKSISQIMRDEQLTEKEVYYKYGKNIFQTAMPQSSIRPRVMKKMIEIGKSIDLISIEYIPRSGKNKGNLYEQFYKGENCRLFAWLKDVCEEKEGVLYKKTLQGTYWDYVSETKNLTKEGKIEFSNGKKPISLIKHIISLYPNKNATILDFFAGSGTTGHAVAQLNKEDGGNRRYILCTNNENEICEKVTYQRLKNIQAELPHNIKYLKTEFVAKFEEGNDERSLSQKLSDYLQPLIELEYGLAIDDHHLILIQSEDDLANKLTEQTTCNATIFISPYLFLSAAQNALIAEKGLKIVEIPAYYFRHELIAGGEL